MTNNNAKKVKVDSGEWEMANVTPGWGLPDAKPNKPQETGFPIGLIVQILMAVLTYLIQRAIAKTDQEYLTQLRSTLERWEEKR